MQRVCVLHAKTLPKSSDARAESLPYTRIESPRESTTSPGCETHSGVAGEESAGLKGSCFTDTSGLRGAA